MSSDSGASIAANEPMIEASGLSKVYEIYAHPQDRLWQMIWRGRRKFHRDFCAVRGVDLKVNRGETLGIVGRNGSGKSTLLKMICGTLQPTAGELRVNGHVAPLLALGAGFNPEFTGRENAHLNAAILGMPQEEIEERLDSVIAFADIGDFFDQPVKSYSTGMYSRLAFAVAINADPEILVVDEVLAVGDEAFTRKCFARIEKIKSQGSTILFVSHSANAIIELCDQAILMEAGERLLTADPKTVIARYHRLLYAPKEDVPEVVEEIRCLDAGAGGVQRDGISGVTERARQEKKPSRQGFGYFDPNLKPESTVEYVRKGAYIQDARILDPDGNTVNVLQPGCVYTYTYRVFFTEDAFRVRFGLMLKLMTGFELGGQVSHPTGGGVEMINAGSEVDASFRFRTTLVPGTYFMNVGVRGAIDGGEDYICRVLDAAIFRIDPGERGNITGQVDLSPFGSGDLGFDLRLRAPD